MKDFVAFRRSAVRYWERRRLFYNLALVPPALFSWAIADTMNWTGDPHETHWWYLLLLLGESALAANICYSFAYGLEFMFGSDGAESRWLRKGRTLVFIGGILFAMVLSLVGGRNIALLDYYQSLHVR